MFEKSNDEAEKAYNSTLKETLHPWWVLTRYCSLLPDWCHPHHDRPRPVLNAIRCIAIVVFSCFVFAMMTFHFVRMALAIVVMTTIHSVIPYLLWFSALPIALTAQLYYISRRHYFLRFFKDWGNAEKQIMMAYCHRDLRTTIRKTRILVYTSKIAMLIGLLVGMGFVIFRFPDAPYLLSHFKVLRDLAPVPVFASIHLITITFAVTFASFCDAVSALVFFHIALEARVLFKEFDKIFLLLNPLITDSNQTERLEFKSGLLFSTELRRLVGYYENLRSFVKRANSLFGILWFLNHGMRLTIICIMLYSVLYMFQTNPEDAGIYFANLVTNLYELVLCTVLMAQIFRASDRLRSRLAVLLTKNWDLITKGDREILTVFIDRLQTDPLAASPLGLYKVTPSFLMTIVSLTVSYVIILLQSK